MSRRTARFAERRAALQLQCELQRQQLAQAAAEARSRLQPIDRAIVMLRGVRASPVLAAAAAGFAFALFSSRTRRVLGRSLLVFTTFRRLWNSSNDAGVVK